MLSRFNMGYQQSIKGTQTTGNNLSQHPQDNLNNITDLYKQDSVSSDQAPHNLPQSLPDHYNSNQFQIEEIQHNQIRLFMKKADKLNEISYRKLHEGKALVPEGSSLNIYKSSKNIIDQFNIPTQRDKQIRSIYLRGSQEQKKSKAKNKIKNFSLHKRKLTTDSKSIQTDLATFETSQIPSQPMNFFPPKKQFVKNNPIPKIKNTLKAIQQDEDEQFIPAKRKNPQKLFNTIALSTDFKRTTVNAGSYLTSLAKVEHEFSKSVKRYSMKGEYQQPTIYFEGEKSVNLNKAVLQPLRNDGTKNLWAEQTIKVHEMQKGDKNLPVIREKSSIHEQTKLGSESNKQKQKQKYVQRLYREKEKGQPKENNEIKIDHEQQLSQNSLFVQNNNNSVKRTVISESQFSILKPTTMQVIDSRQVPNSNQLQNKKMLQNPKIVSKMEKVVAKAQIYVQVPEIREIAIGTDTNNFVMNSKQPIHPIRINFSEMDSVWITSQYSPKSKFLKSIDTTNFHIKKYRNGVYFGELSEEGNKHGHGVVFYFNGRSYEGSFINDIKEGKGFQFLPDGSTYSGDFKNGLKEGRGVFEWSNGQVYDGQWIGGKKNGSGMWKSVNGDSYLGEWKNGKIQGFGVLTVKQGDRYQGQFRNSMKNGLGTQRYSNGDTYVGHFTKNRPNGQGEYYYSNGDYYKGSFSNGLKHGEGYYKSASGQIYQGEFRNQKRCGFGQLKDEQQNVYKGNFENGLKHGFGQEITLEGFTMKGYWINGKMIEPDMGPIIQDQLDRQQSIVNIKSKQAKKTTKQGNTKLKNNPVQKGQKSEKIEKQKVSKIEKLKSPKKSPKASIQKEIERELSPTDPNFHRACGCKKKH